MHTVLYGLVLGVAITAISWSVCAASGVPSRLLWPLLGAGAILTAAAAVLSALT